MTYHALPRDLTGRVTLPGRVHRFDHDFRAGTMPAWLTTTGAVRVTGGELVVDSGTNPGAPAYAAALPFNSPQVQSIAWTCHDLHLDANAGQSVQALSTPGAILGNTGVGVMLHTPWADTSTYLRGTVGDWPVTDALRVDTAYSRPDARVTRTLVYLPRTCMVYALEDDGQVMHARDLTGTIVPGPITPLLMAVAVGSGRTVVSCSRVTLEIGYQ